MMEVNSWSFASMTADFWWRESAKDIFGFWSLPILAIFGGYILGY